MDEVREKKLRQVRALLAKADDPNCPPAEALALRQKADDLMLAYTISEFEASQRPGHVVQVPVRRSIRVVERDNPLKTQIIELFGTLVDHCRCKAIYSGLTVQKASSTATVFGFPNDLDFLEMLFTSLLVQMAVRLEPRYDSNLSEVENLVTMKEAGLKWARIHQLLHPEDPYPVQKAQGVKYTKMYTEFCKSTGRKRMYTSPITYQRNYAQGFQVEVYHRLAAIRNALERQASSGMELVLVDRVQEAYDEAYPRSKSVTLSGRSKLEWSAYGAGKEAGAKADLGQSRVARQKELG